MDLVQLYFGRGPFFLYTGAPVAHVKAHVCGQPNLSKWPRSPGPRLLLTGGGGEVIMGEVILIPLLKLEITRLRRTLPASQFPPRKVIYKPWYSTSCSKDFLWPFLWGDRSGLVFLWVFGNWATPHTPDDGWGAEFELFHRLRRETPWSFETQCSTSTHHLGSAGVAQFPNILYIDLECPWGIAQPARSDQSDER